ncbi:MAG: hypothetical protein IAG13_10440 [Deltaproteobacteria bacterium]|nr:hypothetical protein [Nannocystaceae bacterium]
MMRSRPIRALLLASVFGCAPVDSSSPGSTSTSTTTSGEAASTGPDAPPMDCPSGVETGPHTLPDAVVAREYDVDLQGEWGGFPGLGARAEGDLPPGLDVSLTLHLIGVPALAGAFDFEVFSGDHWVPPGCPGVTHRRAYTITVLDDAPGTDSEPGSTGVSGSSSTSG